MLTVSSAIAGVCQTQKVKQTAEKQTRKTLNLVFISLPLSKKRPGPRTDR
jgi:hypothetical protein